MDRSHGFMRCISGIALKMRRLFSNFNYISLLMTSANHCYIRIIIAVSIEDAHNDCVRVANVISRCIWHLFHHHATLNKTQDFKPLRACKKIVNQDYGKRFHFIVSSEYLNFMSWTIIPTLTRIVACHTPMCNAFNGQQESLFII